MTEALVGRIVYRLHLPKCSQCPQESSSSLQHKKRKRFESSSALATQPPYPAQTVADEDEDEVAVVQHFPTPIAAWIFQPDDQPDTEFILSVPQCLLTLTCEAARLNQTVEIVKYSKILLPTSASAPSLPSQYEDQTVPTTLVEVFRGGMRVLHTERECLLTQHDEDGDAPKTGTISQSSSINSAEIRWTSLSQLAQQERVDQRLQVSSSKRRYSFGGTVDAVSPVISMDPTDPFALLELYDPDSTYTCVVVLRKNGINCQAAILAEDKLILHNVQRQKWRIPAVLSKKLPHLERIPSHVFVVSDTHQVTWDPQTKPQSQAQAQPVRSNDASLESNVHAPAVLPITPSSAPSSLSSLQGSITSVHRIRAGDETHIHYLEIMSSFIGNKVHAGTGSQLQQRRHILYVTYFPMSSSLQLSLRPGSWIQADNIHPFGRSPEDGWTFGACFRSTIAIVKMASESVGIDDVRHSTSDGALGRRPDAILSLDSVVPYPFLRIRRSYLEYACRQLLSTWMKDFRVPLSEKSNLPSLQDLSQVLMGNNNNNNTGKSRKSASRNAYAEFFDHGIEHTRIPNDGQDEGGGCHMSFDNRHGSLLPRLVCLGQLREASYEVLKARLRKYLMSPDSGNIHVGWTGSVTLTQDELGQAMDRNFGLQQDAIDGSRESAMFIGGMTGGTARLGSLQAQLSNGSIVLPVVSTDSRMHSNSAETGFCFAKLACVSISCICIAVFSTEMTDESLPNVRMNSLPLYQCASDAKPSEMGPCSILEIGGRVFMASLSVTCKYFLPVILHESSRVNQASEPYCGPNSSVDGSSSIQSCLDPSLSSVTSSSALFVGLLSRTAFKLVKSKSGESNGCMLTVSHNPFDGPGAPSTETVSCMQSIEVKPAIKVEEVMRHYLRRRATNLLGTTVTDDHLTLALVWWKLGSDERTCALLSGGWDQLVPDASLTAQSIGIMVRIPCSSVQHETKRGYVRIRCRFDDISASLISFPAGESRSNTTLTNRTASVVDCVSSGTVLSGMLDRRPRRITCHGKHDEEAQKRGALVFSPCNPGIPMYTLAGLFWAICNDLKNSSRAMVAPSLVREIRGATLMGISYCRAQACCTKCHKTLYEVHVTKKDISSKNQAWRNGVVESLSLADAGNQLTFWDRPLPMSYYQNKHLVPDQQKPPPAEEIPTKRRTLQKRGQRTSRLRCPENCSVEQHASIKWECSGTIDDGTGQAKLYADRDTVLALLGMDTATVEAIEAGAWLDENGVVFSKSMPPKAHIREAIVTARSMAHNQARVRRGVCREQPAVQEADVLKLLTPLTRADYLMQQFCRTSKRPTRALNYYVKCKPLSDKMSLSKTQVEIAAPGARGAALTRDVGTYSLPPLKLNLVDCRVVPSDVYQSWDGL
jgi:hypothetical protein